MKPCTGIRHVEDYKDYITKLANTVFKRRLDWFGESDIRFLITEGLFVVQKCIKKYNRVCYHNESRFKSIVKRAFKNRLDDLMRQYCRRRENDETWARDVLVRQSMVTRLSVTDNKGTLKLLDDYHRQNYGRPLDIWEKRCILRVMSVNSKNEVNKLTTRGIADALKVEYCRVFRFLKKFRTHEVKKLLYEQRWRLGN